MVLPSEYRVGVSRGSIRPATGMTGVSSRGLVKGPGTDDQPGRCGSAVQTTNDTMAAPSDGGQNGETEHNVDA